MTETGPDLSGAVAAYRALMDDECIVTRNPGGLSGDVLDESTGRIVPRGTPTTVYEGACLLGAGDRSQPGDTPIGGKPTDLVFAEHSFPVDSPEFQKGDVIVCTGSRRDPQLVGQEYVIRRVVKESFLISRDVVAELV